MIPYVPTPDQALTARIVAAQREAMVDCMRLYGYPSVSADENVRHAACRYPWPEYDVTGTPPTEWPVEGESDIVARFDTREGCVRMVHVAVNVTAYGVLVSARTPARRRAAIALLRAQDAPPARRVRVRWEHGAAVAEEVGT